MPYHAHVLNKVLFIEMPEVLECRVCIASSWACKNALVIVKYEVISIVDSIFICLWIVKRDVNCEITHHISC